MSNDTDIPRCPDDWIAIADRELRNISAAYRGKVSGDSKIDHALRATEAMLKAVLWKHEKFDSWPARNDTIYKFVYSHKLEIFIRKMWISV